MRLVSFFRLFVFYFILLFFFHILALEDQLQQAKQHAEQYKSMSEANESALTDLNKVGNKRKVFSRILENIQPYLVLRKSCTRSRPRLY